VTYPSLIGQTFINGAGDDDGLEGIDLVIGGQPTATGFLGAIGGAVALEMGDVTIGPIVPLEGIDLASTGAGHVLVYNMAIDLDGIDLVSHGTPVARMTINHVGAVALEVGDIVARNGTDMVIGLTGIELVRAGFHSFQTGAILPGDARLQVPSYRALEVGDIEASLGPITITAGGQHALEVGDIGARIALQAGGIEALEVGDIGPVQLGVMALGTVALEMGDIASSLAIPLDGIDLGRHGAHAVKIAALALQAGGIYALEVGDLGAPTISIRARQAFALEMGDIAVSRGNAC
jgi:hypothetical protein